MSAPRVVTLPADQFDKARSLISLACSLFGDLEAEAQSAIDQGQTISATGLRDYLRVAVPHLRSASAILDSVDLEEHAP